MEMIICKGLPASGKSTWARELMNDNPGKYKRINKDDLRAMLDVHWSGKTEHFIIQIQEAMIKECIQQNQSIIIDDTNLNPIHEKRFIELAQESQNPVEIKFQIFDNSIDELIKRDSGRDKPVGSEVIWDMWNRWIRGKGITIPKIETIEPVNYKQNHDLPKAIICDLDGTIALRSPDRGWFEWKKVGLDSVNMPVARVVDMYHEKGYEIIFLSGRDGACRTETFEWLSKVFKWKIEHLYMREAKDNRKDSIVKFELWEQFVKGKYFVDVVLDDRNSVVDLWRKRLGLSCFQVNYGNF